MQNNCQSSTKIHNRRKVVASIYIAADIKKGWETISSPGHLTFCHPYCKSNEVSKWPGPGAKDEIVYLNGLKYIREFTTWETQRGYELLIGEEGGPKSKVVWELAAVRPGACNLKISIYPHAVPGYPAFLQPLIFFTNIKPALSKYLKAVLSGIRWYIEKGQAVKKNQFGIHNWFSK